MTDFPGTTKAPQAGLGSLRPSDCVPGEGRLLPCPFCGSPDVEGRDVTNDTWKWAYQIACNNCGSRTGLGSHKSEVVNLWNTRAWETTTASSVGTEKPSGFGVHNENHEALREKVARIVVEWPVATDHHAEALELADAILAALQSSGGGENA